MAWSATLTDELFVLGVSGSPRKRGNTEALLNEALQGAKEVSWTVRTDLFSLGEKQIKPCDACEKCLEVRSWCIHRDDDFPELWKKYMTADAVIFGSPVYVATVSAQLKAAIDRLSNSMCSFFWEGSFPRFIKVGAAVAQGMNKFYQGQDFTCQLIINSFLLWNHIVVSGDVPLSYIGVHGSTDLSFDLDAILKDSKAVKSARILGKRAAETAMILKRGVQSLRSDLPPEYKMAIHGYEDRPPIPLAKGKDPLAWRGPPH